MPLVSTRFLVVSGLVSAFLVSPVAAPGPWVHSAGNADSDKVHDLLFELFINQLEAREQLRNLTEACFSSEKACSAKIQQMQLDNQRLRDDASNGQQCSQNLQDVNQDLRNTEREEQKCKQDLGHKEREEQACKQDLGNIRSEEQKCRQDLGSCRSEEQKCKQDLGTTGGSEIACKQDLQSTQQLLQQCNTEVGQLQASSQQLQDSNQQLQDSNQQHQNTIQQLQDSNQKLDTSNQQLQDSNQQLQTSNQQLQTTNQQLQGRVTGLEDAVQEQATQLQEKDQQKGALQQKVQQLESDVSTKDTNLQELRNKVQQLEGSVGAKDQEIASLKTTIQGLQQPKTPRDCAEALADGGRISDVYAIYPRGEGGPSRQVMCYWKEGRAWTTFLLRDNQATPRVNFARNWAEYKSGFGNARAGEYWLGNENLHQLTRGKRFTLRVELKTLEGNPSTGEWEGFSVASEGNRYRLSLGSCRSCSANHLAHGLQFLDGTPFTTSDKDHDTHPRRNCASRHGGGWWYLGCGKPFPTSPHGNAHGNNRLLSWYFLGRSNWAGLSHLAMMIAYES